MMKILLVEDCEADALIVKENLLEVDAQIIVAKNYGQVMECLANEKFNLIISDVVLPGKDGIEMIGEIREKNLHSGSPILFLTSVNFPLNVKLQGYSYGAIDFILKPCHHEILKSKVTALLELEKSKRDLDLKVKELDQKFLELDAITQALAHNIQNPLKLQLTLIGMIKKKFPKLWEEECGDFLNRIFESAESMKVLVEDLNDYCNMILRKSDLTEIDTKSLIENIKSLKNREMKDLRASIEVNVYPVIHVDEHNINSLLLQLIDNSLKYSKPDQSPEINLEWQRCKDKVKLIYTDNGTGISKEYQEKIFKPFVRLIHQDTVYGSGLGMTLCKGIVEDLNGELFLESEEGKGIKLTMVFPETIIIKGLE